MPLKIYYYGHPILRKRCEPITEITEDLKKLVHEMTEALTPNNAAGFAAPQVGHSLRLFILCRYVETEDGHLTMTPPYIYINPKVTIIGDEVCLDDEACVSIPGIREDVERPWRVRIEAMNLKGEIFVDELEGYNARGILHENDHINGVLFIDRIDKHTRKKIEPALREIKKKHNP